MANEKRLIDANELLEDAKRCRPLLACLADIVDIEHLINDQTTVDAVEVVHGRWIEHRPNLYECSACHIQYSGYGGCDEWRYCPDCGAKMDLPSITDQTKAALEKMGRKSHGEE